MSTSNFSSLAGNEYTDFGKYMLKKELQITLPNNDILCSQLNENNFSYKRTSQDSDPVKKIIQPRTKDFELGLMPLLPIHTPTYKTDFFS